MSDIFYNNKRIPRELFRTNVYGVDENGQVFKRMANSYDEFKQLILSRQWFEHKAEALKSVEKKKDKPKAKAKE